MTYKRSLAVVLALVKNNALRRLIGLFKKPTLELLLKTWETAGEQGDIMKNGNLTISHYSINYT